MNKKPFIIKKRVDFNLQEQVINNINCESYVAESEYLYVIAKQVYPELNYVRAQGFDVFNDNYIPFEKEKVKRQLTEEGLEKLKQDFEAFKNNSEEEIVEKNQKNYESLLFRYNSALNSIKYQEEFMDRVENACDKIKEKYPELVKMVQDLMKKNRDKIQENKAQLIEPKKETEEEYKARIIKTYIEKIAQYEEAMENEKKITNEDHVVNFVRELIEDLKNVDIPHEE